MIVLDASVVIAHLAVADKYSQRAFEILDTDDDLVMHPITLAETLVRPAIDGDEVKSRVRIGAIGIEQAVPPYDEPLAIARLRAKTGLRLPDCCVLATALREGALLATFDARLAKTSAELGVEVIGTAGSDDS